ncbi:MAG: hypothetical protein COB53_07080 [Elusimicrobia bacterium]|nr:MAG: hypothetical protein COB53_07080 [Elusimicrobiota bacterium]
MKFVLVLLIIASPPANARMWGRAPKTSAMTATLAPQHATIGLPALTLGLDAPNLEPSILPRIEALGALAASGLLETPSPNAVNAADPISDGKTILLLQTLTEENGRRGTGYDVGRALEALVQSSDGRIRSLDPDSGIIFRQVFAIEVDDSFLQEARRRLHEIEGVEAIEYRDAMVSYVTADAAVSIASPEDIRSVIERLEEGVLWERMQTLGALMNVLETPAARETLRGADPETLNDLTYAVLNMAVPISNLYALISSNRQYQIRVAENEARGEGDSEHWNEIYRVAGEAMRLPERRAELEPLRVLTADIGVLLSRIGTTHAREFLLESMSWSGHAVLERIGKDDAMRRMVFDSRTALVENSVEESMEGLAAENTDDWSMPSRSHGFENIDHSRHSSYGFKFREHARSPIELRSPSAQLLGFAPVQEREEIVDSLVDAVGRLAPRVEEYTMRARRKTIERETANNDRWIDRETESWGDRIRADQIAQLKRQGRHDAEESSRRHGEDGHSTVDDWILSFNFDRWIQPEGFDQEAYLGAVMDFLKRSLTLTTSLSMARLLTDRALGLLIEVRRGSDLLEERPETRTLRLKARDLERAVEPWLQPQIISQRQQ